MSHVCMSVSCHGFSGKRLPEAAVQRAFQNDVETTRPTACALKAQAAEEGIFEVKGMQWPPPPLLLLLLPPLLPLLLLVVVLGCCGGAAAAVAGGGGGGGGGFPFQKPSWSTCLALRPRCGRPAQRVAVTSSAPCVDCGADRTTCASIRVSWRASQKPCILCLVGVILLQGACPQVFCVFAVLWCMLAPAMRVELFGLILEFSGKQLQRRVSMGFSAILHSLP